MESVETETTRLAAEVLRQLESPGPLAPILPAARRLMVLADRPDLALWLLIETTGSEPRDDRLESKDIRERALAIFLRVRAATDPNVALERVKSGNLTKLHDRSLILSAAIADLERRTQPDPLPQPTYDEGVANNWLRAQLMFNEGQRVVVRVRAELHDRVMSLQTTYLQRETRREMFGPDAAAVFDAGGTLLGELANCPTTLARTGAYLAAQEARTALMKLGRDLYKGPKEHVGADGKTYNAKLTEMHSLYALLDDLARKATDPSRKAMLDEAKVAAKNAYELGSKAKTPTAITHDEAVDAIRCTFRVARALAFNGAFPLPES